jgi:hypothetical protein
MFFSRMMASLPNIVMDFFWIEAIVNFLRNCGMADGDPGKGNDIFW